MHIYSSLCVYLFFNTVLLLVCPENSVIYYAALVLMTLAGSLGHVVFRCFVWDRPAIQSTIGSSILVLISYSVQLLSLKKAVTESFDILAPNWTATKIEENPKLTCFMYSFPVFGLGTLTTLGFLLPVAASFRRKFSGEYLAANHFKLKKSLYIGLGTLITIPYIAQVTVCRSICNWKLFKGTMQNTFQDNSSLQNKNLEDCWIPFLPFLTFLCLILYGTWAVIKGTEVLMSAFKSNNISGNVQSIEMHRRNTDCIEPNQNEEEIDSEITSENPFMCRLQTEAKSQKLNIKGQPIKNTSEEYNLSEVSNVVDSEMQERRKDENVEEKWKKSSQTEEEKKQENNVEYFTKMSSKCIKLQKHELELSNKSASRRVSITQDKNVAEQGQKTRLKVEKEGKKKKSKKIEEFKSHRKREIPAKQEGEGRTFTESKLQFVCLAEKKTTKIQIYAYGENIETEALGEGIPEILINDVGRSLPNHELGLRPDTINMNPRVLDSEHSPKNPTLEGLHIYIFGLFIISFVSVQIMLVFVFLSEDNQSLIDIVFRLSHVIFCFAPWVLILNKDNIMVWFRRMITVKMGFPQNLEL